MNAHLSSAERVVIIGAGPTGLGAAHRLCQMGHQNYHLYEASDHVGGLAASHRDSAGFLWDMGGHVQFSHYQYFQHLMDELLSDHWLRHRRVASIHIAGRLVPYPLQHHLHHLPTPMRTVCQQGLDEIAYRPPTVPQNFREWIFATFGRGIAEAFMLPYNNKVWAYPPAALSYHWIGDRVARPVSQLRHKATSSVQPDAASSKQTRQPWGPNRVFRFPKQGGTGEIWRRLAARLPTGRIRLRHKLTQLNTQTRQLTFANGHRCHYHKLITTMPLDKLIAISDITQLDPCARHLTHSSVHVIGVGLHGRPPAPLAHQCWLYFPSNHCPFYRATVFSNYSPHNVPDPSRYWSVMVEVSESPHKPVHQPTLLTSVVDGLLATGVIHQREQVAQLWHTRLEYGYPTPTLGRDAALDSIQPVLEAVDVYSRGRFGAWKYEVSNQDHSLMQGVEIVDRLLRGSAEITLNNAAFVNAPGLRVHPTY